MHEITQSVKVDLKRLIAVVLVDVDLPYWTSKVEHIVALAAIFNICTAHAQKQLFMNFWCKFRHRRSIRRPRFPTRVQNLGDLATFSVDFCILYAECPPYFYFWFVWLTELESIPPALTPTLTIPTKFEVCMTTHCRVIAFCLLIRHVTLWPCPFDLEQLSYMAGHETNPATKFEDPTTICSWVTSCNGSSWLPLKMRTRPLRMHRITWPVSRKQLHFWNPRPQFAYSLYNFCWATPTISPLQAKL